MRSDKTDQCASRYPYRHRGPAMHGSKLADYLISEVALQEDHLDVLSLARMIGHRNIAQLMTYYREDAQALAKRLD